jgi:protein-L-isoaspartate(D-aspartate) O-methyltransferase
MILLEEEKKSLIDLMRRKGIKDEKLLDAFFRVPREKFVSEAFRKYAYEDNALPIECHQTISQPFTVAYMTVALSIHKGDKVLEIGTGSGYQAAILCELGAEVYTIERIETLSRQAEKLLNKLGYKAHFNVGDGTHGWEGNAPYDKIIVTAAAPSVPGTLVKQLQIDGILVIPVGSLQTQRLFVVTRTNDGVDYKVHESFKFVPLIGDEGWKDNE